MKEDKCNRVSDKVKDNVVEQILPVEYGMAESLCASKLLLCMVEVGMVFFVGFFSFLLYMA
ncbi:hypothetical protein HWQ46_20195 [Shewanella sp. D64]|uniref:hypothetical protein n=1 Tax=unclassified Shewanella TaxID=196818 RepID=UPI0022BA6630|nr:MULTISPECIES: hypothetical protein [unclassified Shewanella]MEC4727860.1 hypothetical protein [Shewanella sp. D64]MEC4739902.1 hypothetical protein [Shewanella sp. E94]WBJ97132.1 hypothetical protein HWQ47_08515 [Shewanella sp. MTB7]